MGGFGSGERLEKKITTAQCLTLDVVRIEQPAVMRRKTISGGTLTWRNRLGERILSVGCWLEFKAEDQRVVHLAQKLEADGTEPRFADPISRTTPTPHSGV